MRIKTLNFPMEQRLMFLLIASSLISMVSPYAIEPCEEDDNECTTKSGAKGVIMVAEKCPGFRGLSSVDMVHCGFKDKSALMCCPITVSDQS